MSDKFTFGSAGLIHELELAMARADGWSPALVKEACKGNILADFRDVLLGKAQIIKIFQNIIRLTLPALLNQPNWAIKLLEDTESRLTGRKVTLDLVDFLQPDESYISGDDMISRCKEKGNLAGSRAFNCLYQNPHRIPDDWKKFLLIFPGTTWSGCHGNRGVQCLYWGGREGVRACGWLNGNFDSNCRVVRIHEATSDVAKSPKMA